jgi:hypothetical protein
MFSSFSCIVRRTVPAFGILIHFYPCVEDLSCEHTFAFKWMSKNLVFNRVTLRSRYIMVPFHLKAAYFVAVRGL